MNTSLTKFCRDHNLPKSSVYRRCQELGFDTADGLIPADCDRLLHEFDVEKAEPAVMPTVTVETGNHAITLATPQLPTMFDLGALRSFKVEAFDDPLLVAQQAIAVADQLIAAAHADIDLRKQRLEATRSAKEAAAERVANARLEARLYELEAGLVDTALNRETQSLIKEVGVLQNLGKPQEG